MNGEGKKMMDLKEEMMVVIMVAGFEGRDSGHGGQTRWRWSEKKRWSATAILFLFLFY